MNNTNLFLLVLFSCVGCPSLSGEPKTKTWDWDLELRARYEVKDGYDIKSFGADRDEYTLLRTNLGMRRDAGNGWSWRLGLQDARSPGLAFPESGLYSKSFGLVNHPARDEAELGPTYLQYRDRVTGGALTLGRQKIFFGDRRIFGPGDWGNSGRWIWDAARFDFVGGGRRNTFLYGRTMLHDPNRFSLLHRHQFEGTAWYSEPAATRKGEMTDLFFLAKRDRYPTYSGEDGSKDSLRQYYGGLRWYHLPKSGFFQDLTWIGETGSTGGDPVSASGWHLLFGHRFPNKNRTYLSLEWTGASGDADPSDGKAGAFDGAFGAIDKFLGRMNLFQWNNVRDLQMNAGGRLGQTKIELEFHDFRLDQSADGWSFNGARYRDKTGSSGKKMGTELDLILSGSLNPRTDWVAGYSLFAPGDFVKKILPGSDQASYLYFQVARKFDWKTRP